MHVVCGQLQRCMAGTCSNQGIPLEEKETWSRGEKEEDVACAAEGVDGHHGKRGCWGNMSYSPISFLMEAKPAYNTNWENKY